MTSGAAGTLPAPDQLALAMTDRDRILERLDTRHDDAWKARALWAVFGTAREAGGFGFIADDVWKRLDRPPQPKALGPILRQARRLGLIVGTGEYRPHPQRHATMTRVWRLA